MTTRPFRGALVGCGFFAENHAHGWAEVDGAELVALCDLDLGRARAMGARFGIDAIHADVESLLGAHELDFVDVVTTAPSHRALVERARARRRHGDLPEAVRRDARRRARDGRGGPSAPARRCWCTRTSAGRGRSSRWASSSTRAPWARRTSPASRSAHGYDNYVNQPYLAELERFTIMDVGLHLFDLARRFLGEVDTTRLPDPGAEPARARRGRVHRAARARERRDRRRSTARSSPRCTPSRSRARSPG